MLTEQEAKAFAHHWVEAWKAGDIEAILTHYAGNIEFVSPFVAISLNRANGKV